MSSTHVRVIPRDLFNEAKLLKCLGQVFIKLEDLGLEKCLVHDNQSFDVQQCDHDGSLYLTNLFFDSNSGCVYFTSPYNSRDSWPLRADFPDDSTIEVFTDSGEFTSEFRARIIALGNHI